MAARVSVSSYSFCLKMGDPASRHVRTVLYPPNVNGRELLSVSHSFSSYACTCTMQYITAMAHVMEWRPLKKRKK